VKLHAASIPRTARIAHVPFHLNRARHDPLEVIVG
jgi:hypothetical protein